MPSAARIRSLFRNLFARGRVDRELDDELHAYLELLVAEKRAAGMSEPAARRAAAIELGGVEHVKDEVRDIRSGNRLEETRQDARYAARTLVRRPGFTLVAVAAIALGIGATSAIFSVVNGVLLEPLPFEAPDRLVTLLHKGDPVSPANYFDWKQQNTVFSSVGAAQYWVANVNDADAPERLQGLRVTADILAMTGVQPLLGRLILPEEERTGHHRTVVLAWGYWQRRFAGDDGAIGRPLVLDGDAYTVVGVMPRGFDFPMFWARDVQVWAPLALGPEATSRRSQTLRVFARLRPEATLGTARAQMAAISARLEQRFPGTNRDVTVTPLADMVVGHVRAALTMVLGAVGFVLLIACVNVAHMLLARAAARQKEMTVRAALGASRSRLVRQLLTESVMLSVIGGAVGLALASVGVPLLTTLGEGIIPRTDNVALDGRVVAFTALVSVLTGLGFGIVPAIRVSRGELADALRQGGRGATEGARGSRLRSVLVASEIALALVLLAGAGLAIRSFLALRAIDAGFDPRGVLSAVVSLKGTAQEPPVQRGAFYAQLLDGVRRLPGVESASAINHLPIAGDIWGTPFLVEGRPSPGAGDIPTAAYRVVFPGYFRTMRLPVLRGRDVAETDRPGTPGVVVVNEWLAERHWPNEDPIGKRLTLDTRGEPTWLTVVGVVKNAVRSDWSEPASEEVYLPYRQTRQYLESTGGHVGYLTLVVRAACADGRRCDPAALVPAIREAVRSLDRNVPIAEVQTMTEVVARANGQPRATVALLGSFAVVALLLAAVGIYGVMSYAVSRRAHEIGVRMALGARPGDVVRLVVRQGMRVVTVGVIAGLAGALILTRLMGALVYGVGTSDPPTFLGVSLLLAVVALLASYVPARRAARIDPLVALKTE